jgi:hypothetical protein
VIDKILSKKNLIIAGYALIGLILLASSAGFFYSPELDDMDAQNDNFLLKANFVLSITALIIYLINLNIRKNNSEFKSFKKYYIFHWLIISLSVINLSTLFYFLIILLILKNAGINTNVPIFLPIMIMQSVIVVWYLCKNIITLSNNDRVFYITLIVKIIFFYLFWNLIIISVIT